MSVRQPPTGSEQRFSPWRFVKNALSALTGTVLVSLLGFFITPFLIHQLGSERFGIWTFLFSFVSIVELSDFGISMGVQRFVAAYAASHQDHKIPGLINQAFSLVLAVMLGAGLLLLMVDVFLLSAFKIPSALMSEAQWSMAFLILSMVANVPMSILSGAMIGYQKYDVLNINWIVFSLVRTLAFVGCVFLPNPLMAMAVVFLLLSFLRLGTLLVTMRRLCPAFSLQLLWPDRDFYHQVVAYGSQLFSISILGRIIYTTDSFLLGLLMGPHFITLYAIGAKWTEICRVIIGGTMHVCFPAFSQLKAMEDHARIRDILLNGSRAAVGVGVLIASLLILLAEPIIHLWVGDTFKEAVPVMRWLGLVLVLSNFTIPFEHYLKATGYIRPLFWASLFNVVCNITASFFLIKLVGVVGVVWGTLIGLTPAGLMLVIPTACRLAQISLVRLIRQLVVPLLLPLLWVFGLALYFHFYPPFAKTVLDTVLWAVGISVAYLLLWMLFDPIPRRLLKSLRSARSFKELLE